MYSLYSFVISLFVFQCLLGFQWLMGELMAVMLSLMLWIVCFYLSMYFQLFLYLLWLCFLYLEWFLCQILSGLLFQLACYFYQFVFCFMMCQEWWYIVFPYLFSSVLWCPSYFWFFSGVVFLDKLISSVGLFVYSWFCTISVRDPLDFLELSEHFKHLKK